MLVLDHSGRIVRVNARAQLLLGCDESSLAAMSVGDLLTQSVVQPQKFNRLDTRAQRLPPDSIATWASTARCRNGSTIAVEVSRARLGASPQAESLIVLREIDSQSSPSPGRPLVLEDPLTRLPNRDHFLDRVTHSVNWARH